MADLSLQGFIINGIAPGDVSGYAVSPAGDINGDGIDDIIIGANGASPNGLLNAGQSYVVFGRADGNFPRSLNLSTLNGSNGFIINGLAAGDQLGGGTSVSAAGDVNGDGIDDVIVGANRADPNGESSGQSYVIFGKRSAFSANFNLSSLNGSNGFVINGAAADDRLGATVSDAGDINGDGFDDVIVGARFADPNGASSGQSYVVFGSSNGFPRSIEVSTLNGSNGFRINGIRADDRSGYSVNSAGDINGDGIDDLILGAYFADPNGSESGQSYVIFGKRSGFNSTIELSTLNGSNGFVLNGIAPGDRSGVNVGSLGDVNGDGLDDIIIGAYFADPNGAISGQSYVVFGKRGGFGAKLELSALNGSNGFTINGIAAGDISGIDVNGAGDVNGDGIDDIIIGAAYASPNGIVRAGQSYVVFGKRNGFDGVLELSSLNGANGFKINGVATGDISGLSATGAGDINGDGIDDIIIGAPYGAANSSFSGQSYVIFGRVGLGSSGTFELSQLVISGGTSGNDILVGTLNADMIDGKAGDDGLFGLDGDDQIFGGAGVDIVIGGGGNDQLFGQEDDDVIFGDSQIFGVGGNDTIDGGEGSDQVFGETGNDSILGGTGADQLNGDVGSDTINGGTGADVIFGGDGNDSIDGSDGADKLNGDAGDDIIKGGNNADVVFAGDGNDTIDGGAANDIINGGVGNDSISGGVGNDRFFAGSGDDQIFGQSGNDNMDGEAGNDQLDGGAGQDILFGSLGNDTLIGGDGVDVLAAGVGSDSLTGGSGNDVLIGVDPFVSAFGLGGTSTNPLAPFEIDTLTGGAGSDTFFLGDNGTVLGNNRGNPELYYLGGGNADYALITDLELSQDTIQLSSNVSFSDLVLGTSSGGSLPSGITLSFNGDLIAILQGNSFVGGTLS